MRRRSTRTGVATLAVALAASLPGAAAATGVIVCKQLDARQSATLVSQGCESPVGLCTEGRVHNGPLRGRTYFTAEELVFDAFEDPQNPVAPYSGTLEIVTRRGTIVTKSTGVFDPVPAPDGDGAFAQFDRIVDADGRFQGATGVLFFTGLGNEAGNGFESELTGELCVPRKRRDDHDDDDHDDD